MFLFLRLVLAHLLADFPLQTSQVYKKKIESSWGQLFHALVIVISVAVFSWPYLGYSIMWFLILVFILLHTAIDMGKVEITNRVLPNFWSFLLDQALHIASLTLVLFFSFSRQAPKLNYPLVKLYNNDAVVAVLIGYILSCFTGTYFLDSFKKTFLPDIASKDDPKMFNAGVIERLLITTVFCFLKIYFYPVAFLLLLIGTHPSLFLKAVAGCATITPTSTKNYRGIDAVHLVESGLFRKLQALVRRDSLRIIHPKKGVVFDFLLNFFYASAIGIFLKIFLTN